MELIMITFIFSLKFTFALSLHDCPQTNINGRGIQSIVNLLNVVESEFAYNRSLVNRNINLIYNAGTFNNSVLTLTSNSTTPLSFASTLLLISQENKREEYQNLQSFPIMAM